MQRCLQALLTLIVLVSNSFGATGSWQTDGPLTARLISPINIIDSLEEIPLALELKLKKDWKTYWRNPGAAGAAPRIKPLNSWLSDQVSWQFPAPNTYTLLGMQSYGYDKYTVLPFTLSKTGSSTEQKINVQASVFACNGICLPLSLNLDITFNRLSSDNIDWGTTPLVNEYLSRVPKNISDIPGLFIQDDQGFYLEFPLIQHGINPEIFVENLDVYEWDAPTIVQQNGFVKAWWNRPEGKKQPSVDGDALVFTYKDSLQAFSTTMPVILEVRPLNVTTEVQRETQRTNIIYILFISFIGGLILNAMPCVLPVLSIKLMSWIELQHKAPKELRLHALATGFGIISFFWIIAGALALLRLGSSYGGWGMQFQNAWFLFFLLILMFVFLANILGRFEIQLPQSLQQKVLTIGDEKAGYLKSYLQGGTATLLATPCSAPFLGTAITFAFIQPSTTLFLVFTFLGIGLATPYIAILIFPSVMKLLPKPGAWMAKLKIGLAIGLTLTILWVLTLINEHIQFWGLVLLFIVGFTWLAMLYARTNKHYIASVLALILAVMVLSITIQKPTNAPLQTSNIWKTYSQKNVADHLQQQHTVLIDVTARWCLTCKFNKLTALETNYMIAFYKDHEVVLLQADWTKPDSQIEALLNTYQRSAIPFNLVLGPNAINGILLPDLLSESDIKDAILNAENSTENL